MYSSHLTEMLKNWVGADCLLSRLLSRNPYLQMNNMLTRVAGTVLGAITALCPNPFYASRWSFETNFFSPACSLHPGETARLLLFWWWSSAFDILPDTAWCHAAHPRETSGVHRNKISLRKGEEDRASGFYPVKHSTTQHSEEGLCLSKFHILVL